MPRYVFDTSVLVKNYRTEFGTADVQRILAETGSEFLISRLVTIEMHSGFAGKVRSGVLSSADFSILRRHFLADIRTGLLRPIRVLNVHYQAAGDLISKHALSHQLRTLDAIQLAVALHIHRSFPVDHFVCSDQRLCSAAILEGLAVIQP
jgi:predicted nucleic acid-binding protein